MSYIPPKNRIQTTPMQLDASRRTGCSPILEIRVVPRAGAGQPERELARAAARGRARAHDECKTNNTLASNAHACFATETPEQYATQYGDPSFGRRLEDYSLAPVRLTDIHAAATQPLAYLATAVDYDVVYAVSPLEAEAPMPTGSFVSSVSPLGSSFTHARILTEAVSLPFADGWHVCFCELFPPPSPPAPPPSPHACHMQLETEPNDWERPRECLTKVTKPCQDFCVNCKDCHKRLD